MFTIVTIVFVTIEYHDLVIMWWANQQRPQMYEYNWSYICVTLCCYCITPGLLRLTCCLLAPWAKLGDISQKIKWCEFSLLPPAFTCCTLTIVLPNHVTLSQSVFSLREGQFSNRETEAVDSFKGGYNPDNFRTNQLSFQLWWRVVGSDHQQLFIQIMNLFASIIVQPWAWFSIKAHGKSHTKFNAFKSKTYWLDIDLCLSVYVCACAN